jgi:hypothetical protein
MSLNKSSDVEVLVGDEASLSGFHRGQQISYLHNRPDVRLQPVLNVITEKIYPANREASM